MIDSKLNLDWTAVEKALSEGTFSGYKIGILETEKLFKKLVENKQIPGKDIEFQIKYLMEYLSMLDKFREARQIYQKIANEINFEISREDTIKTIAGYWQAMIDVDEAVQYLTPTDKIKLQIKSLLIDYFKKIKKIILTVIAILILFLFFGKTAIGRQIFDFITLIAYWVIIKIGLWAIIAVLIWFVWRNIVKFLKKPKIES